MLKKIFCYDFKNLGKKLLPILLGGLACGILGLVASLLLTRVSEAASLGVGTIWVISFLGCFALSIYASIVTFTYYYRKFFTDEGYLTHMFPASVHTQFLAKVLSGSIFWLLSEIVLTIGLIATIALPAKELFDFVGINVSSIADISFSVTAIPSLIFSFLSLIISPVQSVVLIFTAITLGSLSFKKRKVGGSILFYFICNIAVSTATSFVETIVYYALPSNQMIIDIVSMATSLVLSIAVIVVGYLLSTHMLSTKLNLE